MSTTTDTRGRAIDNLTHYLMVGNFHEADWAFVAFRKHCPRELDPDVNLLVDAIQFVVTKYRQAKNPDASAALHAAMLLLLEGLKPFRPVFLHGSDDQ